MLITFLIGEDNPVFFNFGKDTKEFEKKVLFSVATGFPDAETLAASITQLEDFKLGTLSYIAELEGDLDD